MPLPPAQPRLHLDARLQFFAILEHQRSCCTLPCAQLSMASNAVTVLRPGIPIPNSFGRCGFEALGVEAAEVVLASFCR